MLSNSSSDQGFEKINGDEPQMAFVVGHAQDELGEFLIYELLELGYFVIALDESTIDIENPRFLQIETFFHERELQKCFQEIEENTEVFDLFLFLNQRSSSHHQHEYYEKVLRLYDYLNDFIIEDCSKVQFWGLDLDSFSSDIQGLLVKKWKKKFHSKDVLNAQISSFKTDTISQVLALSLENSSEFLFVMKSSQEL